MGGAPVWDLHSVLDLCVKLWIATCVHHLEYLVFLEQNRCGACLQPRRNWSLHPTTCGLIREKQFRLGL